MHLEDYHDFFVASGGVAGALIGLLFVAISVSQDRLAAEGQGAIHRARASASLTAFTNALVVSLFGLVPGEHLGQVAVTVSCIGLLSVAAILLSLLRARALHLRSLREIAFVAGFAALFAVQLSAALNLNGGENSGALQTLGVVIVVCFLLGVARAWELIGGPRIGIGSELRGLGKNVGGGHVGD